MNQRVSVVGIGRLGLCWALSMESKGFDVVGVDVSESYIKSLNNKTYKTTEPHVENLLKQSSRFKATTDLTQAVKHSDYLFVLVQTPSSSDGKYNHQYIESICQQLVSLGPPDNLKHLIIGCTTFPKYCRDLGERMIKHGYSVTYNPEFIAQGSIIHDQLNASMVLIGESDKHAADFVEYVHRKVSPKSTVFRMPTTSAELCKLSLNCFVTTKISFANMIGDIVKACGEDPQAVLDAIASDPRVNSRCMQYGFGFGGPCFPRDNRALAVFAREIGESAKISEATDQANSDHAESQSRHLKNSQSVVIFDHITYKPNTTLIDESQPLKVALELSRSGVPIKIIDSYEVISKVRALYPELKAEYEIR